MSFKWANNLWKFLLLFLLIDYFIIYVLALKFISVFPSISLNSLCYKMLNIANIIFNSNVIFWSWKLVIIEVSLQLHHLFTLISNVTLASRCKKPASKLLVLIEKVNYFSKIKMVKDKVWALFSFLLLVGKKIFNILTDWFFSLLYDTNYCLMYT